ncbi:putative thioredoxin-like protein [Saccharolobus shibatae B12]|uniref:Thioredoxin-like protein n=2 Tax=Saccharolobus shibatae TaxID=2286 RepID=A0A8F5BLY4_SACSH|nr:putative thioredoxin-like protein [Saccharolobus shibatae B12]
MRYKQIIRIIIIVFFIALAVTAITISFMNTSKSQEVSSLIGSSVPSDLYTQLVELSNQGYNLSVTTTNLNILPYNFSSNGKPAVIFVGAEWCPYCGAERWALIIALLRFGNFSNLQYMLSSSTDEYPNVPTFTFTNASYNSPYISFIGIEYENRQGQYLDKVPTTVYSMWEEYGNLSIPFIIIGYYYQVGTTIDPGLLSGKNWTYVIDQLHNPNSPIYNQIYYQANLITKYICKIDGGQPLSVCSHFIQDYSYNPQQNLGVYAIVYTENVQNYSLEYKIGGDEK